MPATVGLLRSSLLKVFAFAFNLFPIVSVRGCILLRGNVGPHQCLFAIDIEELLLILRQLVFGKNGLDRALRLAERTVNALVRVNNQEIGSLVKTIYGAYFHAIGVFAFDAGFANDEGHVWSGLFRPNGKAGDSSRIL